MQYTYLVGRHYYIIFIDGHYSFVGQPAQCAERLRGGIVLYQLGELYAARLFDMPEEGCGIRCSGDITIPEAYIAVPAIRGL